MKSSFDPQPHSSLSDSPLGKPSTIPTHYDRSLLFAIPRSLKRTELGIQNPLPFFGSDLWNAYEVSWLNHLGKRCVGVAKISIPCTSPAIFESKSLKLYLYSLHQKRFESIEQLEQVLAEDLSQTVGAKATIQLLKLTDPEFNYRELRGTCIDSLPISTGTYTNAPELLQTKPQVVTETLYSHLLKSNCLITGQPDWATVQISYQGPQIDQASLLKYFISMRQHHEFHEQCVERIFVDLQRFCQPTELTVYARYTRRGGIDINPLRSTNAHLTPQNARQTRQ